MKYTNYFLPQDLYQGKITWSKNFDRKPLHAALQKNQHQGVKHGIATPKSSFFSLEYFFYL
jgi:hypothetical protein